MGVEPSGEGEKVIIQTLRTQGGDGTWIVNFEAVKVGTKLKPERQKGVGGLSGGRGSVVWEGLGPASWGLQVSRSPGTERR